MRKKLLLCFLAFGMTAAFAASNTFKVDLPQDSTINGKTLKAGSYKIELENGKAIIKYGKESIEVPAREETSPNKFESTESTYLNNTILQEISVGGTHTKIIFEGATPMHSGM